MGDRRLRLAEEKLKSAARRLARTRATTDLRSTSADIRLERAAIQFALIEERLKKGNDHE